MLDSNPTIWNPVTASGTGAMSLVELALVRPLWIGVKIRSDSWALKNTTVALYNSSNVNWAQVRVSAGFWYADYSLRPGQQFRFERFYAAAYITIEEISPNGTPAAAAVW